MKVKERKNVLQKRVHCYNYQRQENVMLHMCFSYIAQNKNFFMDNWGQYREGEREHKV